MQLSKSDLHLLSNFASINQSVMFQPGHKQGTSANLWDVDTLTLASGDIDILRPFNNSDIDLRTRIILGQDTSVGTTNPPNTVPTEPNALLSLVLPPENNDDTTSQLLFINDEVGNPREFKIFFISLEIILFSIIS